MRRLPAAAWRRMRSFSFVLFVLFSLFGAHFAWPLFRSSTPPPPRLWGLWASADLAGADAGTAHMFLHLVVQARHGCQRSATVIGDLTYKNAAPAAFPRYVALSISGLSVWSWRYQLQGSRAMIEGRRKRRAGATVLVAQVARWAPGRRLRFVIVTDAAHAAGYEACYLTSPELFGNAADIGQWARAHAAARGVLPKGVTFADEPIADAVVELGVNGMLPDRGALDAGAVPVHGHARLSCGNSDFPEPPASRDPYFLKRFLATLSSCGSVQTFRKSTAVDDFNLNLFFAGLFVGAALALLVQVLTAPDPNT